MRAWFQRVVLRRLWLTYIVLGLAFFAFGAGSLNLVYMFQANFHLLLDYGWRAVMEGGVWQLLDLLLTGYLSLAAYVVFKACEHRLSHWLADPGH
jgi:hypothetical protein